MHLGPAAVDHEDDAVNDDKTVKKVAPYSGFFTGEKKRHQEDIQQGKDGGSGVGKRQPGTAGVAEWRVDPAAKRNMAMSRARLILATGTKGSSSQNEKVILWPR